MSSVHPHTTAGTEGLFTRLREPVRRYLLAQLRDADLAEDLTQEAFLRVHRAQGALKDEEAADAWVYRIVRNVLIDHRRSEAARPEGQPRQSWEETAHPSWMPSTEHEDDALRREIVNCMKPLVEALPSEQRQALEWVDLEGLPQAEAARRAGLSVSGLKSRVQRARRRLRSQVADACDLTFDAKGSLLDCRADRKTEPGSCRVEKAC